MFPEALTPTKTDEMILPSGEAVNIQVATPRFQAWTGESISNTFGGKPLLNVNGTPVFAELAILDLFIKSKWSGRWVETYGATNLKPYYFYRWDDCRLKEQKIFPLPETRDWSVLEKINNNRNGHSGFLDVMVWKDEHLVFAEAKHSKNDSIRDTQVAWLEAALEAGVPVESFLVVEWNYTA
jgi:hypothetical protein